LYFALLYRNNTINAHPGDRRFNIMGMTSASSDYFERVAGQWDQLRAGYLKESVREAAIAKAYLRPEMMVADVGTGTGFVAAGLAPLVSRVYALDGSSAMLEVARRNLAAFSNVVFQVADGSTLALEDGSVDAVFANMYLHHCADPAAAIREMVRVLKPGGRLVITDMDRHEHEWMRREMADEWLGFERGQVKSWFRQASLVNILVDATSQSCCATSTADQAANAEISVFVATGSRRVTGAREMVEASYGAVAESGKSGCGCSADVSVSSESGCCSTAASGSCCASDNAMGLIQDDLAWVTGYTDEQLALVPAEAANLSLGCGNPTAMASLKPREVVLDIGSGAGIDAFYAARRVGTHGKVIGLDMTPAMLERARRSAEEAGFGQVDFRLGNAEEMPVESGTVDVVLSNCVINLCEDKGKVFEEAYRVLKDGGRLSISDMVSDGPFPLIWRSDPAAWAGCVHGALPEQEYLDLVRLAGFTDIKATRSMSGGEAEGVQVYSLSVSAHKGAAGEASTCCCHSSQHVSTDVIPLVASTNGPSGCCG
jgi:arsenite methyltransferase